jgi:hypothetical protein
MPRKRRVSRVSRTARAKTPFKLRLGKAARAIKLPASARRAAKVTPAKPTISAAKVAKALMKTSGSSLLLKTTAAYATSAAWQPVATFSVCQKTGTARYLDIWDCDHFDGFTDMHRNLAECRVWFADKGYTHWDSPQTRTGRINCYFKAPTAGNYVCNVELQSHSGPATVQCLIDSFNYGYLPFNGSIMQPHPATLSAGYHSFRIRQAAGSYFFNNLTVWKV